MSQPLAYFITFWTYGAWLHGREIGSVDKHNVVGMPFLPPDAEKESAMRGNTRESPYLLDQRKCEIVLSAILEHIAVGRSWFATCAVPKPRKPITYSIAKGRAPSEPEA
jgi:hypothetical protein